MAKRYDPVFPKRCLARSAKKRPKEPAEPKKPRTITTDKIKIIPMIITS